MNPLIVDGVYLSPIIGACAAALLATCGLSAALARLGVYRFVWHRPLVEIAVFCLLLAAVALAPGLRGGP